jgi:hypothetical protein
VVKLRQLCAVVYKTTFVPVLMHTFLAVLCSSGCVDMSRVERKSSCEREPGLERVLYVCREDEIASSLCSMACYRLVVLVSGRKRIVKDKYLSKQ